MWVVMWSSVAVKILIVVQNAVYMPKKFLTTQCALQMYLQTRDQEPRSKKISWTNQENRKSAAILFFTVTAAVGNKRPSACQVRANQMNFINWASACVSISVKAEVVTVSWSGTCRCVLTDYSHIKNMQNSCQQLDIPSNFHQCQTLQCSEKRQKAQELRLTLNRPQLAC